MNSLQELNNYGNASTSYTDTRTPGITFDRFNVQNQTVTINQHDTHGALTGIEIVEVIAPAVCTPTYTINVSSITGATVSWPTVPTGCTVTNPSTGVYTISGVNSKAIWDIVRNPTITLAPTYVGTGSYTSTITYNTTQTKSWSTALTVIDITNMDTADDFYFLGGVSGVITGNPVVIDNYPTTWNVTVTPSTASLITSLTSAGSGGTSSFNATTKVLTITGTKTQVNSHLNSITYVIPSTTKQDFTLTYSADNLALSEGDSKVQQLYTTEYLSATRADESYLTNTATAISNGPLITDATYSGTGYYSLTVTPSTTSAVSTMTATTPIYYPQIDVGTIQGTYENRTVSSDLSKIILTNNDSTSVDYYYYNGSTYLTTNIAGGYIGGEVSGESCDSTASTILIGTPSSNPRTCKVYERSGISWSNTYSALPEPSNSGYSRIFVIDSAGTQFCVALYLSSQYPKFYFYTKSGGSWSLTNSVTGPNQGELNDALTFFSPDGNTFFTARYTNGSNGWFEVYKKTSGTWAYSQIISAPISTEAVYSRILPDGTFAKWDNTSSLTRIYTYSSGTWTETSTTALKYPRYTASITTDGNYYAYDDILYKKSGTTWIEECYIGSNSLIRNITAGNDTNLISSDGSRVILNAANVILVFDKQTTDPNKKSFDSDTKVLTLQGPKSQVNTMIDAITLTPATDYTSNFVLTYSVVTPTSATDSRTQNVNHTS